MPTGYTVSIPAMTTMQVGETRSIKVRVDGPGPLTVNRPMTQDDLVHLRFSVNPQLVQVTSVRLLQQFDHATPKEHHLFGWTWTGQAAERNPESNPLVTRRTYVAYEWLYEGPGDPFEIEIPFDIEMGDLWEITLVAIAKGRMQLDIVSSWLGSSADVDTSETDGFVMIS